MTSEEQRAQAGFGDTKSTEEPVSQERVCEEASSQAIQSRERRKSGNELLGLRGNSD